MDQFDEFRRPAGTAVEDEDPFAEFRKPLDRTPGATPETALQERGISFGERLKYGNLAPANPQSAVDWLKGRGYDAAATDKGIAVKKPGGKWLMADPEGADWMDILDLGDEAASVIASGIGMAVGAGAGAGAGSIPGAMAGGAAGGLVAESGKEALARMAGFENQGTGTNMAIEGAAGAAAPLLGPAIKGVAKGVRAAVRPIYRVMGGKVVPVAAKEAGAEAAGRAARPATEGVQGEGFTMREPPPEVPPAGKVGIPTPGAPPPAGAGPGAAGAQAAASTAPPALTAAIDRARASGLTDRSLEDWTKAWNEAFQAHVGAGRPIPSSSIPRMTNPPRSAFQIGTENAGKTLQKTDVLALQELAGQLGIPPSGDKKALIEGLLKRWAQTEDILVDRRLAGYRWLAQMGDQPAEAIFLKRAEEETGVPGGIRRLIFALTNPAGAGSKALPEIEKDTALLSLDELADLASRVREKGRFGFRGEGRAFQSPKARDKLMAGKNRDQLNEWIWKNQKGIYTGDAAYTPAEYGNRFVWDLEHRAWRSIPLDWTYSLRRPGEAALDLLQKSNFQVPGARGTIGRGLVRAGQAMGRPAQAVVGTINKLASSAGTEEMDPLLRYSLRKGISGAPIYGMSLPIAAMIAVPGAATAGAGIAGAQLAGMGMKALGRAVMRDSGGLIAGLLHGRFPASIRKTAMALQMILNEKGLKAYRDALLAQLVMDPIFRDAVEGG
jgi:hypothetical protein